MGSQCLNCDGQIDSPRANSNYCAATVCKNARARAWRKTKGKYYLGPKRQSLVDRVEDMKATTPCIDCGGMFPPECMDFDHLGDKVDGVATMVSRTRPWEEIEAEIAKCEIVCANCHRIRTRRRLNHG